VLELPEPALAKEAIAGNVKMTGATYMAFLRISRRVWCWSDIIVLLKLRSALRTYTSPESYRATTAMSDKGVSVTPARQNS
jgi:hypothetical protein